MKKIILSAILVLCLGFAQQTSAQLRFHIWSNANVQPAWGPAGYNYVEYYYLPDIETYYHVPTNQFIYLSNGNWVFSYYLSPFNRNYDLYSGYKIVINNQNAYMNFNQDRIQYRNYRGLWGRQLVINNNYHPREVVRTGDRREVIRTGDRREIIKTFEKKDKHDKDHEKKRDHD